MLEQKFHICENYGSWDMVQNALGQSDCGIFQSMQGSKIGCISWRLKLAVSHKDSNGINWFLVYGHTAFSWMAC